MKSGDRRREYGQYILHVSIGDTISVPVRPRSRKLRLVATLSNIFSKRTADGESNFRRSFPRRMVLAPYLSSAADQAPRFVKR